MAGTWLDFERKYNEFASVSGRSANKRARKPEYWKLLQSLESQLDDGLDVPQEMERAVRRWNRIIDHVEWAKAENRKLTAMSLHERLIYLKEEVRKFVDRPGIPTQSRRDEQRRLLQSIKIVRASLEGLPAPELATVERALSRHQEAVEKKYAPISPNAVDQTLVTTLNKRINRAGQQVGKILNVYKYGDAFARRDVRATRTTVINELQNILRLHGGKLSARKAAQAKRYLTKAKSAKPPAGSKSDFVQVLSGGLPTLGKGRR